MQSPAHLLGGQARHIPVPSLTTPPVCGRRAQLRGGTRPALAPCSCRPASQAWAHPLYESPVTLHLTPSGVLLA